MAKTNGEILGGKVRGQIVDLLKQFGTLSERELARALDDLPLEEVRGHLSLLESYNWIVPVTGYRLTSLGRATRV
jgi:predicted ArsR family transcriptional regulator